MKSVPSFSSVFQWFRLDETADERIVEAGEVVIQVEIWLIVLAGEEPVGQGDRDGVGNDRAITVAAAGGLFKQQATLTQKYKGY